MALGGDAKSGVTNEEAKTFADQSVAALAAAVKRGAVVHSDLKEPDFDAIRCRVVAGEEVSDVSLRRARDRIRLAGAAAFFFASPFNRVTHSGPLMGYGT